MASHEFEANVPIAAAQIVSAFIAHKQVPISEATLPELVTKVVRAILKAVDDHNSDAYADPPK